MDDVTNGFGTYGLSQICEEYRMQADDHEKELLLGIKNNNPDPVVLKRLPSGLAVYLSSFKGTRV